MADAATGDAAGRLTDAVVGALRAAGLFKLYLPADLGGLALGLPAACDVIARVAEADGAAGWAVMIGAGPNWFAGRMPDALAREVFTPPGSVVAGSGAPGTATRERDGWRVRGRWQWCSGAPWATWFTFNAAAPDGDVLTIAVPPADVRFDPGSWDVRGLRATASWTAELHDVLVPAARTFSVTDPPRRDGPIFRVPFVAFAQTTMAAVTAGLLRRACDEFVRLAREKVPFGSDVLLADDRAVHDRFAHVVAAARAATRACADATTRLWEACAAGYEPEPGLILDVELASRHLVHTGDRTASALWELAGMSVLPRGAPLGRVLADLHAAAQNAIVSGRGLADAGARLLRP